MADETPKGGGQPDEAPEATDDIADDALGQPIAALLGHALPARPHLMPRVRNSIFRRTLAGDVTRFATWGPLTALLELLKAVFESLGGAQRPPTTEESEDA